MSTYDPFQSRNVKMGLTHTVRTIGHMSPLPRCCILHGNDHAVAEKKGPQYPHIVAYLHRT